MTFSLNVAALIAILCLTVAVGRGCVRADIVRIDYGTCYITTAGADRTDNSGGAVAMLVLCKKGKP